MIVNNFFGTALEYYPSPATLLSVVGQCQGLPGRGRDGGRKGIKHSDAEEEESADYKMFIYDLDERTVIKCIKNEQIFCRNKEFLYLCTRK